MGSLKIIKAGILSSIQDLGRPGFAYYAIPSSGAMDRESAIGANENLAQAIDSPVIECTLIPPSIQFLSDTTISITGAITEWQINGNAVDTRKILKIKNKDILTGLPFRNGMRAYIAISGSINAPRYLKSCSYSSYSLLDSNEHRLLKKGDIISWKGSLNEVKEQSIKLKTLSNSSDIKIYKGPEFKFLDRTNQSLLLNSEFTISSQSNRMGARLDGPPIVVTHNMNDSVPILPGMIQLTPSGQMIVVLKDGQTTGGYPRICYIKGADLSLFNQVPLGNKLRFTLY